ncbi:hypothetical protein MY4824_010067 [Beauveria thailandica]
MPNETKDIRPFSSRIDWGEDTIEGDLPEEEREKARRDQTINNVLQRFHDEPYYATRDFCLEDARSSHKRQWTWIGHGYGNSARLMYSALGQVNEQRKLQFTWAPFAAEPEITGHIFAHLNSSISAVAPMESTRWGMNLFVVLRHLDAEGDEILFTGTVGDPVLVVERMAAL